MYLVHWGLFGDEAAKEECLKGFQLADLGLPHKQDQAKPPANEYSSKEVESAPESTWLGIASGRCARMPPSSRSCLVSCWQILRARISLECLLLRPW